MDTYARATRYEVSVFPDAMRNDPASAMDADMWVVTVEDRGLGKWAVIYGNATQRARVLSTKGEWDYEPIPSSRTDECLAAHRFDLAGALELAHHQAPFIRWNRKTAMDILALHTPGVT